MDFSQLNPEQKRAVVETDGPMMVLAGAGSGKTRTLVHRLLYLMENKNTSPYHLLGVTFSNKAAREMRERVAQISELSAGALQITTFHSLCAKILRHEATYLGLSRNFTIYDDSESLSLIKAILNRKGISQKEVSPQAIKYYIGDIKNQGFYPGCDEDALGRIQDTEIDRDHEFYEFYLEYEKEIHQSNAVDFGGLIVGVIQLFETHPEVLERYQKKFKYILVDEYQDTNRAQFMLIRQLAEGHRNLCVVGDEDQSIYSWRGADIRNILDFEKLFSEAQFIKLEQNYRSSKNIIEAAGCLISKNVHRKGKSMWTDNQQGELIDVIECKDDKQEAQLIGEKIQELSLAGNKYSDMAVFYRNNAQSRLVEDSLLKNKIPYRVVAGIKFYERKEVKDLLSYLKIVTNPKDSLSISRIINVPARGIGVRSLRKFEDEALRLNLSLWETFVHILENPDESSHLKLSTKLKASIQLFVTIIQEAQMMDTSDEHCPSGIFEKILIESGYLDFLRAQKNYEAKAREENLDELYNAIVQHEQENKKANIGSFLEGITLDTSMDEEAGNDMVSLMTVHGSKGLEYPYVFLAGAEENIFPSFMSLEEGEWRIEEERRLFYVAMTRAMKKLTITYALGRLLYGSVKFNGPSRFIDEIPDEYFEFIKKTSRHNSSEFGFNNSESDNDEFEEDGITYSNEFSQESYEDETSYYQGSDHGGSFQKGDRVSHQLYGEGVVADSSGAGQDEKVTIKFPGGTKKKFVVKFAPLEKIY